MTFSVSDLFSSGELENLNQRKRFLLLSGVRWDPFSRTESKIRNEKARAKLGWHGDNIRDAARELSGTATSTEASEEWDVKSILKNGQGSIKISCERFPNREQNIKWCGDRLMDLIKEAKVSREIFLSVILSLPYLRYALLAAC